MKQKHERFFVSVESVLTRSIPAEKSCHIIVAGAGGFDELRALARTDQNAYSSEHRLLKDVEMMTYYDEHGFLKVTLERGPEGISLSKQYYTIPHQLDPQEHASLTDRFTYYFNRNL